MKSKNRFKIFLWVSFFGLLLVPGLSHAASIQKCSAKKRICFIKLEEGVVGDTVKVLDDRAQIAAVGWLIKKQGSYGIISFKQVFKRIERGLPVIVDIEKRGDNLKWASDISPTDAK